jgi:hypothetical protein
MPESTPSTDALYVFEFVPLGLDGTTYQFRFHKTCDNPQRLINLHETFKEAKYVLLILHHIGFGNDCIYLRLTQLGQANLR